MEKESRDVGRKEMIEKYQNIVYNTLQETYGWLVDWILVSFYGMSTLLRLLYAKVSWFGWLVFFGILTLVGYLMPNPFYL